MILNHTFYCTPQGPKNVKILIQITMIVNNALEWYKYNKQYFVNVLYERPFYNNNLHIHN